MERFHGGARRLGERGFGLRPIRLADALAIAMCIKDGRFSYPLLTGCRSSTGSAGWPLFRALAYATMCCAANNAGSLLFGGRRHWIMTIVADTGNFVGVVMIDEVVRRPGVRIRPGDRFLKHPERRLALREGDGELGFFLKPAAWGRGLALAAVRDLIDGVSAERDSEGRPILRRVWAETGRGNEPARRLLEALGLAAWPDGARGAPPRFDRAGALIDLVHYGLPALEITALSQE